MEPVVTAGLITGGASLLGGVTGARATGSSTGRSIKFQREMARNKYQYLMEDLAAAGLNPILAAQGASAGPAGASAPVIPYMNPLGEAVSTGVTTASTAQDILSQKQGVKESQEQVKQITQNIKNLVSQEYKNYIEASSMDQQARASMLNAIGNYKRAGAEIERIAGQIVLWEHQGALMDAQAGKDYTSMDVMGTQKEVMEKQVKQLKKQIEIAEQNLKVLRPIGSMAETDYNKYIVYVERLVKAVPLLGAVLGYGLGRGLKGFPSSGGYTGEMQNLIR